MRSDLTKTRQDIHRKTYEHNGRKFTISVPVTVVSYFINGEWEDTLSAVEMQKIERAIEKKCPNYFKKIA